MKKVSHESHIAIIRFEFKRKLILDKVVMWWLFANVPRILQENGLLTWFECQWFYGTTKVEAIHMVYILVLIRSHLHIGKNHRNLYIFANEMCKIEMLPQFFGRNMAYQQFLNSFSSELKRLPMETCQTLVSLLDEPQWSRHMDGLLQYICL